MNCTKKVRNNEETITMTMDNFIEFIGTGRHTANKIAAGRSKDIYWTQGFD